MGSVYTHHVDLVGVEHLDFVEIVVVAIVVVDVLGRIVVVVFVDAYDGSLHCSSVNSVMWGEVGRQHVVGSGGGGATGKALTAA